MSIFGRRNRNKSETFTTPEYTVRTPGTPSPEELEAMQTALKGWVAGVVFETGKLPETGTTLSSPIGDLTVTRLGPASYDIRKA